MGAADKNHVSSLSSLDDRAMTTFLQMYKKLIKHGVYTPYMGNPAWSTLVERQCVQAGSAQ
jgi:hypothetical protein